MPQKCDFWPSLIGPTKNPSDPASHSWAGTRPPAPSGPPTQRKKLKRSAAGAVSLEPVGSFDRPISVVSDPEDPDRLFVGEREGRIRLHEGGESSLVADLTPLVLCCESERGLLSIALAPDFAASGLLYVAYTGEGGVDEAEAGDVHVDAFEVDGSSVDLGSREEIWSYGFRNPWRFTFDRETGDMVIADVGQNQREEIDFVPRPG